MGVTLIFCGCEAAAIAAAWSKPSVEPIERRVSLRGMADFSLHIVPKDLDLLSHVIGHGGRQPPRRLRPSQRVLSDAEWGGSLLIDPDWAAYVAGSPPHPDGFIADAWCKAMATVHHEPGLAPTSEALGAIAALRGLCRDAVARRFDLILLWST